MVTRWTAPAKLTVSLAVTGVREDGYHLLESEMVTLDLADTLDIDDGAPTASGDGTILEVATAWPADSVARGPDALGPPADNLVVRALAATGRSARVRLLKRIPPGAGLGGGSADAAAVLRWAGCTDMGVAAGLGADVPFCVAGGRALVRGIGEQLTLLPFEPRTFVLVLPPFGVDTAAVYRAFDRLGGPTGSPGGTTGNDLEAAALAVEPRLAGWRHALEEATGRPARLAGSGSTWFVEGEVDGVDPGGEAWLEQEGEFAPLLVARTVPAPT
jgi:4-diphosphocytidyl-2-C-methyl-D-erythritol kinase